MSGLTVENLSKRFRGLVAVNAVSFTVPDGAIVALIGPNGAGKTTTFNMIAGMIRPDAGAIRLGEARLNGLAPNRICSAGIARTFQLVRPFAELSVEDNVTIGCLHGERNVRVARAKARTIIERLGLAPQRTRAASTLTLADRKRLEVARALGTTPKLLLLDEVMAGLTPAECDELVAFFHEINRDFGITILLIEHIMRAVMALASSIIVLNHGEKIAEGAPADIVRNDAVVQCYLGEEAV
jgi:branched-chain amino acid transport system ATP-binding protein